MVSEGMDSEVRPQAHFYPVEWPEYVIHDFYEAEARMDVCIDVDTTQMALLRHDKRDRYDIFIHERDHVVELRNNGHGWDCDYTDRDLRYGFNLLNLWWAYEFS